MPNPPAVADLNDNQPTLFTLTGAAGFPLYISGAQMHTSAAQMRLMDAYACPIYIVNTNADGTPVEEDAKNLTGFAELAYLTHQPYVILIWKRIDGWIFDLMKRVNDAVEANHRRFRWYDFHSQPVAKPVWVRYEPYPLEPDRIDPLTRSTN